MNAFQTSSQLALRAMTWMGEGIQSFYSPYGRRLSVIHENVKSFLNATLAQFKAYARPKIDKWTKQINQILQPFKRFAQLAQKFSKQMDEFFKRGENRSQGIGLKVYAILPRMLQRFVSENRVIVFLRRFFKGLLWVVSLLFKGLFNLVKRVVPAIKLGILLIKKMFRLMLAMFVG